MFNIFRVMLGTALVTAVILYLVMGKQEKQATQINKEQVSMDKETAEFNRDFERKSFRPMTSVIKREERKIQSADTKLKAIEKKEAVQVEKEEKIMKDFDKAVDSFDKELGGKTK
jgi:lysyl-tRNA synthetase class II